MNKEWHITIPYPHEKWATPEGDKTLCGTESPYLVRFEFYENFSKAHMLNESGVCKRYLELFEQEKNRSSNRV
jgi:hypothetical protein